MNKLLYLIFFISLPTLANDFLIYAKRENFSKIKQEILTKKSLIKVNEVFSKSEFKVLSKTKVNPYVLHVVFNKDEALFLKYLKEKYKVLIEINQYYKQLSEPYFDLQWGLKNNGKPLEQWISDIDLLKIDAIKGEDINANTLKETDKKIVVAVVDSGIDVNHLDLKDNIFFKQKECKSLEDYNNCLNSNTDKNKCHTDFALIDHDNNGYPLDCHGWNFAGTINKQTGLQGDQKVFDNVGHGTHVAGIIGAVKNNIGIEGVIQNVKILPVQVSGSNREIALAPGETSTDIFAKGILYAIRSKADIINLSVGWSLNQDSVLMRQMIELAQSKNIIIVAAGGNSSHAGTTFPCSYENVVCVGAHSVDGNLSSFSNFGPSIDIVAPGTQILSTYPMHKRPQGFTQGLGYEYMSGTSQAAPFVTGALAKLLNLGFSPKLAVLKLLSGTRNIEHRYIRHGNLDVHKAYLTKINSFLYPFNKSPILIKWELNSKRSFKLKIKNYGNKTSNILIKLEAIKSKTQNSIDLITKDFSEEFWDKDETKTFQILFNSDDDIESDIYFKVSFKSDDEEKDYILQTQAIRIISPSVTIDNSSSTDIENVDFIQGSTLRPFENFTNSKQLDFIAIKEDSNNTFVSLVKADKDKYIATKPIALPIKNPIFLKFSKVDINLDNNAQYILTLIDYDSNTKERVTKFLILDSHFKPMRLLVSPKNEFDNQLSVLPGSFIWLKYNGKKVPAWIGYGKKPISQRQSATPWQDAPLEYSKFHMYLLTPNGLMTIDLKENESQFVSFLYQTIEEKIEGSVKLITSNGFGFLKNYKLYNFNNSLQVISSLELSRYHDLLGQRPLPINSKSMLSNAYFFTPSVEGAQNVSLFWVDGQHSYSNYVKLPSFNTLDPIQFVLSANEEGLIFQTKHHLGFYDTQNQKLSKIESKVDAKRIRHQLLKYSDALFLSSEFTPGLTSEVVSTKKSHNENIIYRSSLWRIFATGGCESIGPVQEDNQDKFFFFCSSDSKIIKLCY